MRNKFYEIGIEPKGNSAQQKLPCPNCVKIGKTNIKDTCLSIDYFKGLYNCHKCGWKGCVKDAAKPMFQKPIRTNFTELTDSGLQLFTNRGITQEVVLAHKIKQENGWVVFPYLRDKMLVNVKKRALNGKDFRQTKDAEVIVYNLDQIKGQKEIIICEGEFDVMAFEVAGFKNVTSVNQGAPNENDKNVDKKLECITNCYDVFEQAETIYIAVDKDANGKRLEKELIIRFGAEKCKIINFPNDHKDANDVLIYEGKEVLKECFKNAIDVKVDGVFNLEDVRDSMLYTFHNGKRRGETTYFNDFDTIWTHRTGEVTIWTGYMNEGKSKFLKQLLLINAKFDGVKTAVFSPEEFPADEFYDDIIHSYIGKSTDSFYKNVMNKSEYEKGMEFVKKHFFYVYPEKDHTWESVKNKMLYLIRRQGVKRIVLDPYNQFDHNQGNKQIDQYVSWFMSQLKRFALETDTSVHLVAHQVTPSFVNGQDFPEPSSYKIKGGGTFADKADNVAYVWRPFRKTDRLNKTVKVCFEKVKNQRLVGIGGEIDFEFDTSTNRYMLYNYNPLEKTETQSKINETFDFLSVNDNMPF